MEEILHQLIGGLSHCLEGFSHQRWCRISSIHSLSEFHEPILTIFLNLRPPHRSPLDFTKPSDPGAHIMCRNGSVGYAFWYVTAWLENKSQGSFNVQQKTDCLRGKPLLNHQKVYQKVMCFLSVYMLYITILVVYKQSIYIYIIYI